MWHSGFFPNLIMSLKGNILCLIDKKISTMTEALHLRNEFLYKNLSYYQKNATKSCGVSVALL